MFTWGSCLARAHYLNVREWDFAPYSEPWLLPGEAGLAVTVTDWSILDGELKECQFAIDLEPMLPDLLSAFGQPDESYSAEEQKQEQQKLLECAASLERMAAQIRAAAATGWEQPA